MVSVPDSLRSLFTAAVRRRGDSYVIEVPASEVETGALVEGATYRVAVVSDGAVDAAGGGATASSAGGDVDGAGSTDVGRLPAPPVSEGERRRVVVESVGEQGDGIAKVDRGYVLIVPDGSPGEEVVVEVDTVKRNVAFTEVVERPTS
jgi:predicted RNA-binding protein with TRAM domain